MYTLQTTFGGQCPLDQSYIFSYLPCDIAQTLCRVGTWSKNCISDLMRRSSVSSMVSMYVNPGDGPLEQNALMTSVKRRSVTEVIKAFTETLGNCPSVRFYHSMRDRKLLITYPVFMEIWNKRVLIFQGNLNLPYVVPWCIASDSNDTFVPISTNC